MNRHGILLIVSTLVVLGFQPVDAQENLAEQVSQIFQAHCMNCHGAQGTFKETLLIDRESLIESGTVIPGDPLNSEFYRRITENTVGKPQMPLGTPPLSAAAIDTVRRWILAGAPDWDVVRAVNFITPVTQLTRLRDHLSALPAFDRPYARYFSMTHLYNAGEGTETLHLYRTALSKLINSLSWGSNVINPVAIDPEETLFYIDLRDYDWDRSEAWRDIEAVYPYRIDYDAEADPLLFEKLTVLRENTETDVPFVHVDWFLATASLPPLYHSILGLPETDRELERSLGIDVARNLRSAPGVRVWRAGFNDSGVSNHNRVVERHKSPHGAYWKSYDFAGSSGKQNVYTHPLSFQPDGGEIVFHLPNGLQAYLIVDADGTRIDVAPTSIVSNPQASFPEVHNGLSCIGCHTEGMKPFTDTVRASILGEKNPAYDKEQALRLYVEKTVIDPWVAKDAAQFRDALEATGAVFGGLVEPVSFAHEAFIGPVSASHAAAAVGLETETFLNEIREKSSLQSLGLLSLDGEGGNVKRDAWTNGFSEVISALNSPDTSITEDIERPVRPTTLGGVYIPDANLRRVIEATLGKAPGDVITSEDIARLTRMDAADKGIRDLTGLEHARQLEHIEFQHNAISDLTPLSGLTQLRNIKLRGNKITDVSPLARLVNVDWLGLEENEITDVTPLSGLVKLNGIGIDQNPVSDVSPLAEMRSLEGVSAWDTAITDFSALSVLPRLRWINFSNLSVSKLPSFKGIKNLRSLNIDNMNISDISGLAGLTSLQELRLSDSFISDVSPLAKLTRLKTLQLHGNLIGDVSPLKHLTRLEILLLQRNRIRDVSPLSGLTNLKELRLDENAISDFSPLEEFAENIVINSSNNPGRLLQGGPKITGPWLWVVLPGEGFHNGKDLLAQASGGKVTELSIATEGAKEGEPVGNQVWTSQKIDPNDHNTAKLVRALGIDDSHQQRVMYGSIILHSRREQQTTMFAGSDNAHKVYLNGTLVNEELSNAWAWDYQQSFPVRLKQGRNVLFVAVFDYEGGWSGAAHFGFAPDTEYTVLPPGARFTFSVKDTPIEVGDTFTVHLDAANVTNFAGWSADLIFDPAVLKVNNVRAGNFLKQGGGRTYFPKPTIDNTAGRVSGLNTARTSEGGVSGEGRLLSVTFTAKAMGESIVVLRNFRAGSSTGEVIVAAPPEIRVGVGGVSETFAAWDVNADGITDGTDVVLVTESLGQSPPENPRTDVNGDGVVDGADLAIVAAHLGEGAAAAAPFADPQLLGLTPESVEAVLDRLRAADDGSLTFRRGITTLEALYAIFVPQATVLLANYPNPFNPETWIPYHLAPAADVRLHIYTADGHLVRTLSLGDQPAGIYSDRSRAAYWDGRNAVGEPVASGVYFYTLTAGDFTATRKMLIRK
ncbi:hypothetical protein C6499_04205 [Candidatus Poribacteria bacterium]|nr:MAG: hypothetical protein C6499_04205 [Candidatus Poribacteria bacterium]